MITSNIICPKCGFFIDTDVDMVCLKCKTDISPFVTQEGKDISKEFVAGGVVVVTEISNPYEVDTPMFRCNLLVKTNGQRKKKLLFPHAFFRSIDDARLAIDDYKKYPYFVGENPTLDELYNTVRIALTGKQSYYSQAIPIYTEEDKFNRLDYYMKPYIKYEPIERKSNTDLLWDKYMRDFKDKHIDELSLAFVEEQFASMDLSDARKGTLKRAMRSAISLAISWELRVPKGLYDYVDVSPEMQKLLDETDNAKTLLEILNEHKCPPGYAIMYVNELSEVHKVEDLLEYIKKEGEVDMRKILSLIHEYTWPEL